jgi:hypothetical protein
MNAEFEHACDLYSQAEEKLMARELPSPRTRIYVDDGDGNVVFHDFSQSAVERVVRRRAGNKWLPRPERGSEWRNGMARYKRIDRHNARLKRELKVDELDEAQILASAASSEALEALVNMQAPTFSALIEKGEILSAECCVASYHDEFMADLRRLAGEARHG